MTNRTHDTDTANPWLVRHDRGEPKMPTIEIYEGTDVRVDTTLESDLQRSALELGDVADTLTDDVLELCDFFGNDSLSLDMNRAAIERVALRLAARTGRVRAEARNVGAIRDKAVTATIE